MNSEISSRKWFWSGVGLQFAVGYSIGFLTFFFGTLINGGSLGALWMPVSGWCFVAIFLTLLVFLILRNQRKLKIENAQRLAKKQNTPSLV
jgi:ferrous iron transport protein B